MQSNYQDPELDSEPSLDHEEYDDGNEASSNENAQNESLNSDSSKKSDLAETISQSHEADAKQEEIERLNYLINQEEKLRKKYMDQISKLEEQLEDLAQEEDENNEKYDAVNEELNTYDILEKDDEFLNSGDFFHRMTCFDIFDAYYNGFYEGQQKVIKEMQNITKKQKLTSAALQKKYEQLIQQIPGYVDTGIDSTGNVAKAPNRDMEQLNIQIKKKQEQLKREDEEFTKLTLECRKYQIEMRDLKREISDDSGNNIERMKAQIEELDREIKEKLEELKKTEEEYKSEQSQASRSSRLSTNISDARSQASSRSEASEMRWLERQQISKQGKQKSVRDDDTWMKEREMLLQNIQKVKIELRQYEQKFSENTSSPRKRTKSDNASTFSSKTETQIPMTKTFLRQAMTSEVEQLRSGNHPIIQAIDQERIYGEKLDQDLQNVYQTKKSIEEFSTKLFAKQDEDYDNKKQRIDMLKAELAELREKVGN